MMDRQGRVTSDDYGILDGYDGIVDSAEASTPADWSEVADQVRGRLAAQAMAGGSTPRNASASHRRRALVRAVVGDLRRAGREEEATLLLGSEVEATLC